MSREHKKNGQQFRCPLSFSRQIFPALGSYVVQGADAMHGVEVAGVGIACGACHLGHVAIFSQCGLEAEVV